MNTKPKAKILDGSQQIDFAEINYVRETKNSFCLTFSERIELEDAYEHTRDVNGLPFNVLVEFSFKQNKEHPDKDVLRCRKVCHYLRVYSRLAKRPCPLAWTRFNEIDTDVEDVMILTSVTHKDFPAFKKTLSKWKFENLFVEQFDDETTRLRNGRYISVKDDLLKASDSYYQYRNPKVYSEKSGLIKGRMSFCSFKLHRHHVTPHKVKKAMAGFAKLSQNSSIES